MTPDQVFERELKSLKDDVRFFAAQLKEVAADVMQEGYSQYPVFVAHQHEVALGEVLFDKDEYQRAWTFNATVLEELLDKKVVHVHKREAFEKAYKNPLKHACIFWITTDGASFVFVPYGKEEETK